MDKGKYADLVISEPIMKEQFAEGIDYRALQDFKVRVSYNCITEPFVMVTEPHKHDFDQYLVFVGGNPLNIRDFQAEIELSMGEECEKYIINKTTVVYIPTGFLHCPLNFARVDKPIIFQSVYLAPEYERGGVKYKWD